MEKQLAPLKIVPCYTPSLERFGNARRNKKSRRLTSSGSPSSITKVKNACAACREKKTRCSGPTPCIRCQRYGQPCHYMPTASHRPDTPNATRNIQGSSPIASIETTSERNLRSPKKTPRFSEPQAPEAGEMSDTSLRQVTLEEPPQEDQYGHFYGSASGLAFLQYAKGRLASLPSMSIDFSDYPLSHSGKLPAILPPKSVADVLVHDYFDFGITTSHFVHEPSLFALYERLYNNEECDNPNQDDLALVYMVMAIGSHYSRANTVFCGYAASVRFFDMAQRELHKQSSKVALSSIQARLLIIHYLLNHSRMHETWSSFGIIVRHAQALRLQCPPPEDSPNYIEREYHTRVFWSIYAYDRILSSIFGRPCALHDDDIDQEECALANDEDITATEVRIRNDPTSFCSAAALIHYTQLARILGQVLREFYSPVRKWHNLRTLQSIALDIETQLQNSQKNLPPYLDYLTLPTSAMSVMTQRQMCSLKLLFAHTSMLLYCPFMLYSIRANARIPSSDSNLAPWFKHCGDKSVEAANLVVDECRSLFDRGLFSRLFWLVNYVQFAAIGTLYMYSCLWPDSPNAIRNVADEAMEQFPVGVEGDLVGQRYLEILKELQVVTLGFHIGGIVDTHDNNPMDLSQNDASLQDLPIFDDTLMNYGDPWSTSFVDTSFVNTWGDL